MTTTTQFPSSAEGTSETREQMVPFSSSALTTQNTNGEKLLLESQRFSPVQEVLWRTYNIC